MSNKEDLLTARQCIASGPGYYPSVVGDNIVSGNHGLLVLEEESDEDDREAACTVLYLYVDTQDLGHKWKMFPVNMKTSCVFDKDRLYGQRLEIVDVDIRFKFKE